MDVGHILKVEPGFVARLDEGWEKKREVKMPLKF